jgi:V-type H+-transporting ATPase subunit C
MDGFFTSAVAKVVDTLRNLLNNDPARLEQHILVNEKSCEEYLLRGWRWNAGKYGVNRSLRDIIDTLNKVLLSASPSVELELTYQ